MMPLVDPADIAVDHAGRWVIADRGDRVIKVIDPELRTTVRFGAPGLGPGEFQALVSGGIVPGSNPVTFGYDLVDQSVSFFDHHGQYLGDRSFRIQLAHPFASVRAIDSTTMVASGWIPYGRVPAIHVFDGAGEWVGGFLELGWLLEGLHPDVSRNMGVVAHGREGVVFSGIFGHDSVFAHDLRGRKLGSGTLRTAVSSELLLRVPELARENGGSLRNSEGQWVHQGYLAVRAVHALGAKRVALQLAPVSFRGEHDLLTDGGPVVIMSLEDGQVVSRAVANAPGALLGVDNDGSGLVLRLSGENLETVELFRMRVREGEGDLP
jgi:hypothetical protein